MRRLISLVGSTAMLAWAAPALSQFQASELDEYSPVENVEGEAASAVPQDAPPPVGPEYEPADVIAEGPVGDVAAEVPDTAEPAGDVGSIHYDLPMPPPPPPPPPPAPEPQAVYLEIDPYGYVKVNGSDVNEFYYIRQDHFNRLPGANRYEKLVRLVSYGAFGPHGTGSNIRLRYGSNYFIFPICNYQLSWARRRLINAPVAGPQNNVSVQCH
jgi:hypothetical protein